MNNGIADDLPRLIKEVGLIAILKINSNEFYDSLRLGVIKEYDRYVEENTISMTMKLNEVRGEIK